MNKHNENHIKYKTKNVSYNYNMDSKIFNVEILNMNKYNREKVIQEINNQLVKEIKYVKIVNIKDLKELNNIIEISSLINSKVLIDVSNNIKHLYKDSFIELDFIGKNTKLKISNGNEIVDNNFTTWAHNKTEREKLKVVNVLRKNDKLVFLKEEKIINELYNKVKELYPDFPSLTKKEQFDIVFDYIGQNYICDINILNYQDRYKIYSQRSKLLKLVTNNSLLNIDCYIVKGTLRNGMIHEWNEVIMDNELYDFDITYDMKYKKDVSKLGREVLERNTKINDLYFNNNEIKIVEDPKIYELKPIRCDLEF